MKTAIQSLFAREGQIKLKHFLILASLSSSLVACGGNIHGPTKFTERNDRVSDRIQDGEEYAHTLESIDQQDDKKKQQKASEYSGASKNIDTNSNYSGFSTANSSSNNANWGAYAPALATGLIGAGSGGLFGALLGGFGKVFSKDKNSKAPAQATTSIDEVMDKPIDLDIQTALEVNEDEVKAPSVELIAGERTLKLADTIEDITLAPNSQSQEDCNYANGSFSGVNDEILELWLKGGNHEIN